VTDIILPFSLEAEEAAIGCVLYEPDLIDLMNLSADDFYLHKNRFIWSAILAIHSDGLSVDFVTVNAELERRHQLQEIGGAGHLYDLMNMTPNAYNAESYAEVVKRSAVNRRHIELAQTMLKGAMNGGVDVAAAIDELSANSAGNRDGRHISKGLDDFEQAIIERRADPQDVPGIPTGFKDWDKRSLGLHKQQVLLLGGESGTGKTTILFQAALHAAKAGYGVAIFEKEMSEESTLNRMIELETGVPFRAMMTGRMTDEQYAKFKVGKAKLSRLNIFINDDPGTSTADIRSVISRVRVRQPVDTVYLDYLGLLDDPGDDWDQTKAVRFRALCRALDVAGFAIQDMVKFEGIPDMQDMSGGSKVRFGADSIYAITKDEDNENLHYLLPLKERYGDTAKRKVRLMRKGLAFFDVASDL